METDFDFVCFAIELSMAYHSDAIFHLALRPSWLNYSKSELQNMLNAITKQAKITIYVLLDIITVNKIQQNNIEIFCTNLRAFFNISTSIVKGRRYVREGCVNMTQNTHFRCRTVLVLTYRPETNTILSISNILYHTISILFLHNDYKEKWQCQTVGEEIEI